MVTKYSSDAACSFSDLPPGLRDESLPSPGGEAAAPRSEHIGEQRPPMFMLELALAAAAAVFRNQRRGL